jgi:hypothetical protein
MVVAEGVAVGLLHGAADRRADVGEKQWGADVAGELAEVLVVPRRFDAAVDTGGVGGAVPADAEPSPFVGSAPSRECRLWSTNEFVPP